MNERGFIMDETYSGLFDFLMYFLKPFGEILSTQQYNIVVASCAQVILILFVSGIISAMFGAFGYLLGTKRGGKRG